MLVPFPFERFVPVQFSICVAREAWQIDACHALRRVVFCEEQRIFAGDDRDGIDPRATMLAAVTIVAGMADAVVGTVRIHEAEPGHWFGSRLAVQPGLRRIGGLGTGLIRLAVGTAHARGCTRFSAHVQEANVALFQSLHWQSLGAVSLHGHPHHLMQADLRRYPPIEAGELPVVMPQRAAA